MDNKIKVYIKVDKNNLIKNIQSSIFLKYTERWIKVDEGNGDKFAHAQNYYLDKSLYVDMIPRYKYVDGVIVERTAEEIEAEKNNAILDVSETDLLKAQLKAETERRTFLEGCLAEMASLVYG